MPEFAEIYETMMNRLGPDEAVSWVDSAFGEGLHCTREYDQMRQAYLRLCGRLDVEEEDEDLDIMVDCMEQIQRELCWRMFECGMRYVRERRYLPGRNR